MIILLNGTSSAGKTTLAKALQDALPTPYLVIGIDTVVFALPHRYVNDPAFWREVYRYTYQDGQLTGIAIEPYGDRLVRGMHRGVAGLASSGLDVIVDHVLSEPHWRADIEHAWSGLDVLRVGVLCPLEVAEERERTRANRTLGWAKAHAYVVHATMDYDMTVDTSRRSPTECAKMITSALVLSEPRGTGRELAGSRSDADSACVEFPGTPPDASSYRDCGSSGATEQPPSRPPLDK